MFALDKRKNSLLRWRYGRPTVSLILLVNYHFATHRSLVGLYIYEIKCQLIGLSHLTIYYHHHHCRRHHQDMVHVNFQT
jgi:hypothetical protein